MSKPTYEELEQQVTKLKKIESERQNAEEALRKSEEKFREIIESTRDIHYRQDFNTGLLDYMSPSASSIFGYTIEEIMNMNLENQMKLFHPEDLPKFLNFKNDLIDANKKGKRFIERKFRMLHKSGEVRWMDGSYFLTIDDIGDPKFIIGELSDITEHKKADEALEEAHNSLLTIINTIPDPVYVKDIDSRFVTCNEATIRELSSVSGQKNLTFEYVIGKTDHDFLSKELADMFREREKKILQTNEAQINEETTNKEKTRFSHNSKVPLVDSNGISIGLVCMNHDITNRKNAEDELQRSEKKYRELTNSIPLGIFDMNLDGYITYVNEYCLRLFGYTDADLKKGFRASDIIAPIDRERALINIRKRIKDTYTKGTEYIALKKDGTEFFSLIYSIPIIQDNKPVGLRGFIVNITERKKVEEKLKESEKKIKSINRELNTFINSIPDMAWFKDTNSNFIIVNKAFGDAVGMDPEYLVNNTCQVCFGKEAAKEFKKGDQEVIRSKKRNIFEENIVDTKGNTIHLETIKSPYFDESGKVLGTIGVARDITERKKAEVKLKESENLSSSILNNSPNPIIGINPDTSIKYVNSALENLTGFSASELIGIKAPYPWWPEEKHAYLKKELKRALREGIKNLETQFINKSGEEFWVEMNSIPVSIDEKRSYYLSNWAEITDRKKAEKALIDREESINIILNTVHDIIFQLTPSGFIKYVSPKVKDLYGYDPEDLVGKHFKKTTPVNEIPKALNALKSVLSGKGLEAFEINQFDVNGKVIPMEINLTPVKEKNKIVALQGVMRDITERKKFESDLKQKDRQMKNIVEHSNEIFYAHDKNHKLTYISHQSEQIMGYTPEEMMVKWTELATDNPVNEIGFELTEKAFKTAERQPAYPLEVKHKDGTIKWVEIDESPLKDENGIVIGMVGAARDITERKKTEDEKNLLEKQLFESQKMESIGRLAGGVAHDFNNILSVIMGYADLLRQRFADQSKEEGKAVETIFKNTLRARTIVTQLLGFSRRGKYNPEPVSINTIIRDSVNVSEKIFEKKIEVIYDLEENIHLCEADKSQMDQVLTNLIINAKDAMPGGGEILIKTENVYLDEDITQIMSLLNPGDYIKASITDSGIGIPEEIKDNIFEPFYTTKGVGEGTGLGLATVYGIIKNHEGYIDVSSKPGKGSTFTFYLPVSEKSVIEMEKKPKIIKGDKTILVVDDEEDFRALLMDQLESLGYKVLLACDGIEAMGILKIQKDTIDLVLLDMIMPGIDGRDTFIALKKIDPDVKVLLLSGYSLDERATEILKDGVIDFLQKPLELTELSKALDEALKK
ncbi:MAG: PAS domain S-box protein [bacterium]|nr:PAS domain S-box protein [bacterium]